jgi:uncharacterized damage-inducible protein DinB
MWAAGTGTISSGEEMMKCKAVGMLILAASFGGFTLVAHNAPQKTEAAKAVPGESQIVLAQWNEIGRKLMAMAEDWPEEKYDFKATPAVRSFAEQLLHVANGMYYFTNPVQGQAPPEEAARSKYKSKAEVVAYLKKAIEDGAAEIKAKGDKGMSDSVTDPDSKQTMHALDAAYGTIEHSGEHYGQLVEYYRVAGMVPPESRPKK